MLEQPRQKTLSKTLYAASDPPRPAWIRTKGRESPEVHRLTAIMREQHLHSVCEEAICPNRAECFQRGTATFLIMGEICTRFCPFCNVAHGQPPPLDCREPAHLATAVRQLSLNYVVITSVTRDDLSDGGAAHFAECITALRHANPAIKIEILVPDFRRNRDLGITHLQKSLPDVFNHNIETVPRIYPETRPGADYQDSLDLLQHFKEQYPKIPTKSGLMVGLGETDAEILSVMGDLRLQGCDMLTIGQYLRPSRQHLPVRRFVRPEQFETFKIRGLEMGFSQIAAGPLVRSSYNAEIQTRNFYRTGTPHIATEPPDFS